MSRDNNTTDDSAGVRWACQLGKSPCQKKSMSTQRITSALCIIRFMEAECGHRGQSVEPSRGFFKQAKKARYG